MCPCVINIKADVRISGSVEGLSKVVTTLGECDVDNSMVGMRGGVGGLHWGCIGVGAGGGVGVYRLLLVDCNLEAVYAATTAVAA